MDDVKWMQEAITEARKAYDLVEVPVGAVVVKDGKVISRAHNLCETEHCPSDHAEILAMQAAFQTNGSLQGCTLYVTLEPCAMCAGAMIHYQLPRLVFGAFDRTNGCCGSRIDLTDHWFEHCVETIGGILEEQCASLLSAFFSELRKSENRC